MRVGEGQINPFRVLERRAIQPARATPDLRGTWRDEGHFGLPGELGSVKIFLRLPEEARRASDLLQQFRRLREAVPFRVIRAIGIPLDHPRPARDDREHPLRRRAAMRLHETAHRHLMACHDAAPDVRQIRFPLPHARVAVGGFKDKGRVRPMIVELMPVQTRSAPARRGALHRIERNAGRLELPRRLRKHLRGRMRHEPGSVIRAQRIRRGLRSGSNRLGVSFASFGALNRRAPDVKGLHLVPGRRAQLDWRQLLRLNVSPELLRAPATARDVLLRKHTNLIRPQRPRFLRLGGAMLLDGPLRGLGHQRRKRGVEGADILDHLAVTLQHAHGTARTRTTPINMPELGPETRRVREAQRAHQAVHTQHLQGAALIDQNGRIAMPHPVTGPTALARPALPIATEVPDQRKPLGHRRRLRKELLQPLATIAGVDGKPVELGDELRRHLVAQCAAGKGKAHRRPLRSRLNEAVKHLPVVRELKFNDEVRQSHGRAFGIGCRWFGFVIQIREHVRLLGWRSLPFRARAA